MFAPIRSIYALRPHAPAAVLAASAAVTAMFTATPFLIPELAADFSITAGTAGWISVVQVGAFALATFVAGRRLPVSGGAMRLATLVMAVAAVASAFVPSFALLVSLRAVAGAAGGAVTALVWADAMRDRSRMGGIALTGPATALVGGLVFGLASPEIGHRGIYLLLAAVAVPGVVLKADLVAPDGERGRPSRSRSNRVLLLALFLLTSAGASLFVYEAVIAGDAGVAAWIVAASFSLNAAGGLVGARIGPRVRRPGWWLATTGLGALVTVVPGGEIAFVVGMTWWGFAFWMGLPGVLRLLSERSIEPGERAGDAQGWMAFGRALGPLAGGVFVDASAPVLLAVVSASGLATSGALVGGVQMGRTAVEQRATRHPPIT